MGNYNHVDETLELLVSIRADVHDEVDNFVLERLDEAIGLLKEAQHTQGAELSPQDVLKVLGKALEVLPAIIHLLKLFNDCQ